MQLYFVNYDHLFLVLLGSKWDVMTDLLKLTFPSQLDSWLA